MIDVALGEAPHDVAREAPVGRRRRREVLPAARPVRGAALIGGERLRVAGAHPRRGRGGRGRQIHLDAAGVQLVDHPVEPLEVPYALGGLDAGPGEDAEADDVDARLAHEAHVLVPDVFWPLVGVVVGAVQHGGLLVCVGERGRRGSGEERRCGASRGRAGPRRDGDHGEGGAAEGRDDEGRQRPRARPRRRPPWRRGRGCRGCRRRACAERRGRRASSRARGSRRRPRRAATRPTTARPTQPTTAIAAPPGSRPEFARSMSSSRIAVSTSATSPTTSPPGSALHEVAPEGRERRALRGDVAAQVADAGGQGRGKRDRAAARRSSRAGR